MSEVIVDVTIRRQRIVISKRERYVTLRGNTEVTPTVVEYTCVRGSATCAISARRYSGRPNLNTLACDYLENGKALEYASIENNKCEEVLENKRQDLESKGYGCS